MTRRSRLILLVYLDLLFALFAGLGLLNLVLGARRGRTPHTLERDFLILTVHWKPGARSPAELNQLSQARLPPLIEDPSDWLVARTTQAGGQDDGPTTVFVAAPMRYGLSQFEPANWDSVLEIEYSTRRGKRTYRPGPAPGLRITTEESR